MKNRQFMELTDDEIKEITTWIFVPTKIGEIRREDDTIFVSITAEWEKNKEGTESEEIVDDIEFRDPWCNGENAIFAPFEVNNHDLLLLKQFCYAHHVRGWLEDGNPFSFPKD